MAKLELLNLKEWLTVADAAKHLAPLFGEGCTEADVLQLALDGWIQISVYFPNPVELTPADSDGGSYHPTGDESHHAAGVYDLEMSSGSAMAAIKRRFLELIAPSAVVCPSTKDGIVVNPPGRYDPHILTRTRTIKGKNRRHPVESLPGDALLVVRTEAMRTFKDELKRAPANPEKSLQGRERDSMLVVIGALLNKANIKPLDRGASGHIERAVGHIGAYVSNDTVLRMLSKIPAAVDARDSGGRQDKKTDTAKPRAK